MVSFQGMRGAFSDEAIDSIWRGSATLLPLPGFAAAVSAVANGDATHAVIPVHNTTIGPITAGCDAIAGMADLVTVGQITAPIRLSLLALPGTTLGSVRRVYSHPAALAQCSRFFAERPTLVAVEAFDTAGAAFELAARNEPGAAALAPLKAAGLYGLQVLAQDVQDRDDNATRFAIVMRRHEQNDRCEHLDNWLVDRLRDTSESGSTDPRASLHAIRGAITVPHDDLSCISLATQRLLGEMTAANGISASDVVSAVFTMTPDLRSMFPATAARQLPGWDQVPLLCAAEIDVPSALPHCIRALVHAYSTRPRAEIQHAYLGDARILRPDIARPDIAAMASTHVDLSE
ncbi:MAG: chorismate mutase [Gemmatimonadaceae bacterium]